MKTNLSLIALFFVSSLASVSPTDNQTSPKADQTYPLQLLPKLDELYFNQTIDFLLPENSTTVIDHVEFEHGRTEMIENGFRLWVESANVPEAAEELRVYVRNTEGDVQLAYQRKISLMQKVNKSVADDEDLFKLDDEFQSLSSFISREKLFKAHQLKINAQRFNAPGIELKEFDIEISTGNGVKKLHSPNGGITEEMKAALRNLSDGDFISISNIISEYKADSQRVKMNINYTVKLTIGNVG